MKARFEPINTDGWLFYCHSEVGKKQHPLKLHIALKIADYDLYWSVIYDKLKDAVDAGTVLGFKVLNRGDSHALQQQISHIDASLQQDPNARIFNNPFTVYLHEKTDTVALQGLLSAIEALLEKTDGIKEACLSQADLPISKYISLRQEQLAQQYVAVNEASAEQLQLLAEQAQQNPLYSELTAWGKGEAPKDFSHSPQYQQGQRNLQFHNLFYGKLHHDLQKDSTQKKLQAALEFFNLDFNSLQEAEQSKKLAIIQKAYRKLALQYHPDKLSGCSEEMLTASQELMALLSACNAILIEYAERPETFAINIKELKESSALPLYQYQLPEFIDDPYCYIHMAKSSEICVLHENWAIKNTAITLGEQEGAVVLYVPELEIYQTESRAGKRLTLPGYEAFWKLFSAHALPGRFDQGHLGMIFMYEKGYTQYTEGEKFLLEKMLTTDIGLASLDSHDVLILALQAQQAGICDFGQAKDHTDIVIWMYLNKPESIYGRRMQKWLYVEWIKIDAQRLEKIVKENPSYLQSMDCNAVAAMIEKMPSLQALVSEKREYSLFLSNYELENKYIDKFFQQFEKNSTCIEEWLLDTTRFVLHGHRDVLKWLSPAALNKLLTFYIAPSHDENLQVKLPAWFAKLVTQELASRTKESPVEDRETALLDKKFQHKFAPWSGEEKNHHEKYMVRVCSNDMSMLAVLDESALVAIKENPLTLAAVKNGIESFLQEKDIEKAQQASSAFQQQLNALQQEYETLAADEQADNSALQQKAEQLRLHGVDLWKINNNFIAKYQEEAREIFDEVKKTGLNQKQVERLAVLRNCAERLKGNLIVFSAEENNALYGKYNKILAVKSDSDQLLGIASKECPSFGISDEDNVLAQLEKLYDIHKAFGDEKNFCGYCIGLREETCGNFVREKVEKALVEFIENELAVLCQGERTNEDYKAKGHRFYLTNFRDPKELLSLCERMGKTDLLATIAEKAYLTLAGRCGSARVDHDFCESLNHKAHPVSVYIALRLKTGQVNQTLELLAVQARVYRILENSASVAYGGTGFFSSSTALVQAKNAIGSSCTIEQLVQETNSFTDSFFVSAEVKKKIQADINSDAFLRIHFQAQKKSIFAPLSRLLAPAPEKKEPLSLDEKPVTPALAAPSRDAAPNSHEATTTPSAEDSLEKVIAELKEYAKSHRVKNTITIPYFSISRAKQAEVAEGLVLQYEKWDREEDGRTKTLHEESITGARKKIKKEGLTHLGLKNNTRLEQLINRAEKCIAGKATTEPQPKKASVWSAFKCW